MRDMAVHFLRAHFLRAHCWLHGYVHLELLHRMTCETQSVLCMAQRTDCVYTCHQGPALRSLCSTGRTGRLIRISWLGTFTEWAMMEARPSRPRPAIPSGFRDETHAAEKVLESRRRDGRIPDVVWPINLFCKMRTGWRALDGMAGARTCTGTAWGFARNLPVPVDARIIAIDYTVWYRLHRRYSFWCAPLGYLHVAYLPCAWQSVFARIPFWSGNGGPYTMEVK
jgi:hypothetical protein